MYITYMLVQKVLLSGPQNQHHKYIMRSTTLYKISCIFIHFWKWVVSKHGSSTQIRRRCGSLPYCLADRSACSFFKFCKFLVAASIFVVGGNYTYLPPVVMCPDYNLLLRGCPAPSKLLSLHMSRTVCLLLTAHLECEMFAVVDLIVSRPRRRACCRLAPI